ncbi:AI-2E family transporter [Candidatus Uhrbacteria bacterium]|nr:AI-2E family transporter [Candidatus Uhrbacteria bacterium]
MATSTERSVTIKTGTILKVVAILLALGLMWMLRDILTLLIVALFIAALIHPAARWAAKHRIPKGLMVILIYLVAIAGFALALRLIVPTLVREITNISQTIGASLVTLARYAKDFQEFSELHGLSENLSASLATLANQLGGAATGVFSTLTGIFGGIAGLIVVLVMAFYMVVEDKEAVRVFRNFVPERHQAFIADLLMQVEHKIGGWLRGQLTLSFAIALLYYVGLLVIGVPGPLPLALFAGFAEFVPYLGPILAGIPIIIVAFSDAPVKALFAGALMVVIQQVENQILAPKVMQKAVGLNPLVSIVAVLVGAKLFGVVGVLLAIPFATSLSVLLTELYRYRQDRV